MKNEPTETSGLALSPDLERRIFRDKRHLLGVKGNLLSEAPHARTFYVTSCFEGDGKSLAAIGLAYGMAVYGGNRVLLADGSGAPKLHEHFGVPLEGGLAEFLQSGTGGPKALYATRYPHLFFMPAGLPKEGEIPAGQALRERLGLLQKSFDFIVVDGESILDERGAPIMAGAFDAAVLVVACEQTKGPVARMGVEKLESIGCPVAGVVMNKRRYYIPRFLYARV